MKIKLLSVFSIITLLTLTLGIVGTCSGPVIVLTVVATVACVTGAILTICWITAKINWYESILDTMPFPISVTDAKRNWTFINRPVESMLGVKREDMIGKPCSNWGAGICNTDNCGITCLERGKLSTTFGQAGLDFKVDIAYLTDRSGTRSGHVEIVHDISAMVKTQKVEAALVKNIEQVSESFAMGSGQIAVAAQALAKGTTEQAASIEELSGSIAEITNATQTNVAEAKQAASLADTIKVNAEKGSRQMNALLSAIEDINQAGQDISQVIKEIDSIAFQTNILSLNASVEAARAAQHGKGFAVVAEEVRALAQKSADTVKNTDTLIANSKAKAELGARIANETAASLSEIVAGINENSRLVADIAESSEKQAHGISLVNSNIEQVNQVVQQNSATAEESAAASEEMSSQAQLLGKLIEEFQAADRNP